MRTGRRRFEKASWCDIPSTPACCTGRLRSSFSWRCCRGLRSTRRGCIAAFTPIFGGGPTTRLLHPWFSLGFVVFFALQMVNWIRPMTWTPADSPMDQANQELRDERGEARGRRRRLLQRRTESCTSGRSSSARWCSSCPACRCGSRRRSVATAVAIGYVLHDVAALVMLVGFIVHIYESTAQQPGTFRAMTRGTVSRRWAWTHHPAWYRAGDRSRSACGLRARARRGTSRPVSDRPCAAWLSRCVCAGEQSR